MDMEIEDKPIYDFTVPFEFRAIVLTAQGSLYTSYEAVMSLQWEDIVAINEFYLTAMLPNDRRPKTNIRTKYGEYTAIVSYVETRDAWHEYKKYSSKASTIFKLN